MRGVIISSLSHKVLKCKVLDTYYKIAIIQALPHLSINDFTKISKLKPITSQSAKYRQIRFKIQGTDRDEFPYLSSDESMFIIKWINNNLM
jgi:hypothetical protein